MRVRGGALGVGLALAALSLGPSTAIAAQPTAEPDLAVVEQSAWVASDGDFEARFALEGIPADAVVEVGIFEALETGEDFAEDFRASIEGEELGERLREDSVRPLAELLDPLTGEAVVRIPVRSGDGDPARVNVPDAGIRPVRVRVKAADGSELDTEVVHLVHLPEDRALEAREPTQVAVVLPVELSSLLADGTIELTAAERSSLSSLVDLLRDRPDVPFTLAVSPASLEALERSPVEADAELLEQLAAVLAGRSVIRQPYAELDMGAWASERENLELYQQFVDGQSTLERLLGTSPELQTWPLDQTLTSEAVELLRGASVDLVVVDPSMLDDEESDEVEAGTAARIPTGEGDVAAFVADERLHEWFDAAASSPDDPAPAIRLLTELAALALDADEGASLVLSSPGVVAGASSFHDELAAGLDGNPLLEAVSLEDLPRNVDSEEAPPELRLRDSDVDTADLLAYLDRLAEVRTRLTSYRTVVTPDPDRDALVDDLLRTSADRDLTGGGWDAYLNGVEERIGADLARIRPTAAETTITLTSRRASLPLSLTNEGSTPVTVLLRLDNDRVQMVGGSTRTVVLEPGDNRLELEVDIRTSGQFGVDVELLSPDEALTLGTARYEIRSTAVSGVGIVLSAAALVFLFVWWVRNFRQGRRNQRLVQREEHPSTGTVEPE